MKNGLDDDKWIELPEEVTRYYAYKIRGKKLNDIIEAGGAGEIVHYNGSTWHSFIMQTRLQNGNYYSVDIKGDIVVAVGENNPKAVIIIGRR
jgi:hypothetical protein